MPWIVGADQETTEANQKQIEDLTGSVPLLLHALLGFSKQNNIEEVLDLANKERIIYQAVHGVSEFAERKKNKADLTYVINPLQNDCY